MSLKHFFAALETEGSGVPSDESLNLLSGIDRLDAHKLVASWLSWEDDRVVETLKALQRISMSNPRAEFDTIFKTSCKHGIDEVRAISILALRGSTDLELVTLFIQTLQSDSSEAVRGAAAEALEGFADLAADRRLPTAHAEKMIDALTDAVARSEFPVRGKALVSLAAMPGFDSTGHIHRLSDSTEKDDARYGFVLLAMGRSGDRQWLPEVERALSSLDSEVRIAAADAFGAIAEDVDVDKLAEPLDDYVLAVQLAAVEALKTIGSPAARGMLKQAEDSSEPEVREAVKSSLQALKDEDELMYAVSPTMLDRGLYGAPMSPGVGEKDVSRYDAPTREGWANVDAEGNELDGEQIVEDIGEDMEDYIESDEFFKASNN